MASRKTRNTGVIASILLISLVGGAVMGAYVMTTPEAQRVPDALRRHVKEISSVQGNEKRIVPRANAGVTSFEKRDIKFPPGVDHRVYLVNDYLGQLHGRGLGKADAQAIGIDVRNGVAYLDFNQAFEDSYGSEDEATVLNGILVVLGQFPEIEKVQFEIDGKPMDSMGNVDLSDPQPVFRPGQKVTETSTAP